MIKFKAFKIFAATIFSFALLFPIAIQSFHALDGHQHQVCNDFTAHIHKKQLDCSICDFHFHIFDFSPYQLPEFVAPTQIFKQQAEYRAVSIFADAPHFYLRGPPLLS